MADKVAELREKHGMPFEKIAEELGTSIETVTHAHDLRHSQAVADAAENGKTPDRGNPRHLSDEIRKSIRAVNSWTKEARDRQRCGLQPQLS